MNELLICPFSGKPLRRLEEKELTILNERIEQGQFLHYSGITVDRKLVSAYTNPTTTYIFPVFDGIVFLKKDTAITSKGRTLNPHIRIREDKIKLFYDIYPLLSSSSREEQLVEDTNSELLSPEEVKELKQLLPKSGHCFLSAVSHDVDAIYNLRFNTRFEQYIHIDFSLQRLRTIQSELGSDTLFVLCDVLDLPFGEGSINALFSFDLINMYDKKVQNKAYEEIKRVMTPDGFSVLTYEEGKPLHARVSQKIDKISSKAKGLLAPWSKQKKSQVYFHPVKSTFQKDFSTSLSTSHLNRQFSS